MCVSKLQKGATCTPIHYFIERKLDERVEMILSLLTSGKGFDVYLTARNGDGNTPLHLAAGVSMPYPKLCAWKHTVLHGCTDLVWQRLTRDMMTELKCCQPSSQKPLL